MYKVALVGYTNAGKSSLMNLLSDADVLVEDKLFATLDTTVRKVSLQDHPVLLSDTVGFIHKLPHHLVASFRSTLQEVQQADLILKVIDLSSTQYEKHLETVNEVLMDLGVSEQETLTVFNKIDNVRDEKVLSIAQRDHEDSVLISVLRQVNIHGLEQAILEKRKTDYQVETLKLDHSQQKLLAYLHRSTEVLSTDYDETSLMVTIRARKGVLEQVLKQSKLAGL